MFEGTFQKWFKTALRCSAVLLVSAGMLSATLQPLLAQATSPEVLAATCVISKQELGGGLIDIQDRAITLLSIIIRPEGEGGMQNPSVQAWVRK